MIGLELCIDAKARESLNDLSACSRFIDKVIQIADMTELERFQIELPNGVPSEPGISVTCVIIESHIALHTWPERGSLMFNLVSCKPFDAEAVATLLKATFDAQFVLHREFKRTI